MMVDSEAFLLHSPVVNLRVVGVNIPAPVVAQVVQPPVQLQPVPVPVPVVVPVPAPIPVPYVAPPPPFRRDRN